LYEWKRRSSSSEGIKRLTKIFYLYVPLLNPDHFLEQTLWLFRLFCNRRTAILILLAAPGACYLVIDGLPRVQSDYLNFFNLSNVATLWITIAFTKLVHELAHAYTAKSFGLEVPVFGVGLVLFFPVLYCDTTQAWTLADRQRRMAISAAGIAAEVVLAVAAVYVWYFTRPGQLNSMAFYVMTFSLISTIVFNGNPLSRFDGYFVLMDYLRIPNLAAKAIGYLKYLWMNGVLGLTSWPCNAADFRERMIFLLYGSLAYMQRVCVAFGIVIAVYYRFDKLLGLTLAIPAVFMFIINPVVRGSRTLADNAGMIRPRLVGATTAAIVLVVMLGVLVKPWSSKSIYPCYMASAKSQKLTAPLLTTVTKVNVKEGSAVQADEVLFSLDPEDLQVALIERESEHGILKEELQGLLVSKEWASAPAKDMELRQKESEIHRIRRDLAIAANGVLAPFDGVVARLSPLLQPGYQPGEGKIVGELQSVTQGVIHAFVSEGDIETIGAMSAVKVWFPVGTGAEFSAVVQDIRMFSEKDLGDTPFTVMMGGEAMTEAVQTPGTRKGKGRTAPLDAQYVVSCYFDNENLGIPMGMTGRLVVSQPPKSMVTRVIDGARRTFNRETLF
ncbi:MAG: site-2 protease family protein, partial [Pseudomonadota bacterium]